MLRGRLLGHTAAAEADAPPLQLQQSGPGRTGVPQQEGPDPQPPPQTGQRPGTAEGDTGQILRLAVRPGGEDTAAVPPDPADQSGDRQKEERRQGKAQQGRQQLGIDPGAGLPVRQRTGGAGAARRAGRPVLSSILPDPPPERQREFPAEHAKTAVGPAELPVPRSFGR